MWEIAVLIQRKLGMIWMNHQLLQASCKKWFSLPQPSHSLREQNEIREIRERNQRQCVWWIQLGKNKIYEECPHCFLPDSQAMSESLESGASTSATTHDWLIVCLPLPPTPQSTTTEATLLTSALFPAALIPFRFLQFFLRQGSAGPLGTQKQS